MIIGPNGSGKSSILCAICIGLAGKPEITGRDKNVSSNILFLAVCNFCLLQTSNYIKHGCNKCTIEIEISNNPE